VEVDDALCPLLKTVVMHSRRMRAVELEGPRQRTLNHDLLDFLDRELAPFDTVIQQQLVLPHGPRGRGAREPRQELRQAARQELHRQLRGRAIPR
jgi:hypothetical protein